MPYANVNRAQFRALVRNQLGSGGLSSAFWRDDELNKLIQEALRFFNLCCAYWKTRATLVTVANQVWYALPGAITSGMRVSFNGQPMTPVGLFDLDFQRPIWESETTTTGSDVPTRPTMFGIGALNLIAIWPADAAGNNSLVIDGVASTPILTNDNSKLDIGQEEMGSLLDLIQHLASFKEGGLEFRQGMGNFKAFLEMAGRRNAILKASATWRKWMGIDTSRKKRPVAASDETVGAR